MLTGKYVIVAYVVLRGVWTVGVWELGQVMGDVHGFGLPSTEKERPKARKTHSGSYIFDGFGVFLSIP